MAGRVGFEEDVGGGDELAGEVQAIGGGEVEGDAALPLVVVPEVERALRAGLVLIERPDPPRRAAARRLDLDHFGAEPGEELAGELAALVGDLEDADAAQRI